MHIPEKVLHTRLFPVDRIPAPSVMLQELREKCLQIVTKEKEPPMSNTKQGLSRFVRHSAVVAIVAGGAWVAAEDHMPDPGCENTMFVQCYEKVWAVEFQRRGSTGSCATYTVCPVTILCAATNTYTSLQPDGGIIPNTFVQCRDFENGSAGPNGECVGGSEVLPSISTTSANVQNCKPGCVGEDCGGWW